MKRSMSIILALILILSVASCTFLDELLSVNLFAESMELNASDVQTLSIRELLDKSDSNAFYKIVEDDPDIKPALLGRTAAIIDPESPTEYSASEIQEAGVLGATVIINTSPAGDLLANTTALANGLPDNPTMEDLLDLLLPSTVYSNDELVEDSFVAMINAFVEADTYYQAIGTSLETTTLVAGASAGDLAVGAYLAAVITTVDKLSYDTIGDYLYAVLTVEGEDAPDFTAPDTDLAEYSYLAAILDAAKIGDLLNL